MRANANGSIYACGGIEVRLGEYPLSGGPAPARAEMLLNLHHVIAVAIACRSGNLSGHETRFLRSVLGLTPEQLSDRLDLSAGTFQHHELCLLYLDQKNDVEIRRMIFTHLDLAMPPFAELDALYKASRPERFAIAVRHDSATNDWKRVEMPLTN
jgi:hypothetical protein